MEQFLENFRPSRFYQVTDFEAGILKCIKDHKCDLCGDQHESGCDANVDIEGNVISFICPNGEMHSEDLPAEPVKKGKKPKQRNIAIGDCNKASLADYWIKHCNDDIKIANAKTCFTYKKKNHLWEEISDSAPIHKLSNFFVNEYWMSISLIDEQIGNPNTTDDQKDELKKHRKEIKKCIDKVCDDKFLSGVWKFITQHDDVDKDVLLKSKLNNGTIDTIHLFPIANNKVVNLETGRVLERQKEHFFSYTSEYDVPIKTVGDQEFVDYDAIDCSDVERYVGPLFNWDKNRMKYVQIRFGGLLSGDILRYKSILLVIGEKDHGKTEFLNTVINVLGDMSKIANPELLFMQKSDSTRSPESIHALLGSRMLYAPDIDSKKKLHTSMLKRVSGGDKIPFRMNNSNTVMEVRPVCTLVIAANNMISIDTEEDNSAFVDRFVVIPLPSLFKEMNDEEIRNGNWSVAQESDKPVYPKDPRITEMLKTKDFQLKFFVWLLQGAKLWYKKGELKKYEPEDAKLTFDRLKQRSRSAVQCFMEECCEILEAKEKDAPLYRVGKSDLWSEYRKYDPFAPKDNSAKQAFYEDIVKYGMGIVKATDKKVRVNGKAVFAFENIRVLSDDQNAEVQGV